MGAVSRGPGRRGRALRRLSSPAGIQQRHDARVKNTPKDNQATGEHFITPGSRNPRKVGR